MILPDRDIRGLLTDVIADGDPGLINPNGIELRLGKSVRFLPKGEEEQLEPERFLKEVEEFVATATRR